MRLLLDLVAFHRPHVLMHWPATRWLVPAFATAVLAAGAAAQGVVTGTLNPTGVSLNNGVVSIHFSKDGTNPIEVDITDLSSGHTFLIGGDADLWRTQLVNVSDLMAHVENLTTVGDSNCSQTVQYALVDTFTNKSLTLTFTSCSSGMGSDSFTLKAKVVLDDGAKIAHWELIAPNPTMTQWAFWNSGYYLSVFEDHVTDPTLDYELLSCWGTTTHNPGQLVIDSYPAHNFHAPTQLSALYDSDGNGLYVAFADGTGDYPKEYLYESAGNNRVRVFHRQYFDGFATTRGFRTLPLAVGRFTGDWFSAAEIYRDWVGGTEITSRGLLVSRPDIADEIKDIQMVGVITQCESWEPEDYSCPVPPPPPGCRTVAEKMVDFEVGRDIDNLTTVQFGPGWPVNGGCGIGAYTINPTALADMAQMAVPALSLSHGVYVYDTLYSESDPTWVSENWAANATVGIAGPVAGGQGASDCNGTPQCAITPIDPSTDDWESRMTAVGQALGAAGVDGVFVDNMFPEKGLYCFSTQHAHAPGFGPYLIRGYAETFQNLRAAADPNEQFFTYTESFVEGYIRNNSMYSPLLNPTDWMTNDLETDFVPLTSAIYHHYAVTGPAGALGYLSVDYSAALKACDPLSSCQARRNAAFLIAYSWINGGPVLSVDTGFVAQGNPFSFEVVPPAFPHYAAIADFEARLASVRGRIQTRGFLNTGLRLRDLEFLAPDPMPMVDVFLPTVVGLTSSEVAQAIPALLSSVWKKADDTGLTNEVAVAMINHSSQSLPVSFTFDPSAYGMCSSPTDCAQATFQVYETDLDSPASESLILTFQGTLTTGLPGGVAAEDARFFRVVRLP